MERTISRRIIIRIDQFFKLRNRATKYDASIGDSLYDRAWSEPLTKEEIEQYWVMSLLKNLNIKHCDPVKYFFTHQELYDSKYINQLCRPPESEDGSSIWVWPPRSKDEKQLVWGIFEKDVGY